MSANQTLRYEVFVSDPIGLNVDGPLPNGEPRMFAPLSSTLIFGAHDAVLTDPPLTIDQGKAVGDWIEATGKTLTHIFVTHGHGDHWFTAGMLSERFGAQLVASAGTIEQMHVTISVRDIFWDKLWPGQLPDAAVTAVVAPDNRVSLEGHNLHIVDVGHGDTDDSATLHSPDLGLVVAADAVYNGVHQFLGESTDGGRDRWRKAIDTVAALRPRGAVAGHKNKELDDAAARSSVRPVTTLSPLTSSFRRAPQRRTSSTPWLRAIRTATSALSHPLGWRPSALRRRRNRARRLALAGRCGGRAW